MTSGLGSPTTSQSMTTVSPSTASVDNGFVTKRGSFEYLKSATDDRVRSTRSARSIVDG